MVGDIERKIAPGSRRMSLISLHRSDGNLEISCLKLSSVKFRDFHPTVGRYHCRSDLFFALVNTLGRFVCSICVRRFQEVSSVSAPPWFQFQKKLYRLAETDPVTIYVSLHSRLTHSTFILQPTTHTSHFTLTTNNL
jgi:hypothetical protein